MPPSNSSKRQTPGSLVAIEVLKAAGRVRHPCYFFGNTESGRQNKNKRDAEAVKRQNGGAAKRRSGKTAERQNGGTAKLRNGKTETAKRRNGKTANRRNGKTAERKNGKRQNGETAKRRNVETAKRRTAEADGAARPEKPSRHEAPRSRPSRAHLAGLRQSYTSKGIRRQGNRLFCKEFPCFSTMPCRHVPLLVHF